MGQNELMVMEYKNIRVLTTQQIAEAYGTDSKVISKNFERNKDRYTEGKHFICLKGDELREFKTNRQNDDTLKFTSVLYLWTKKGAFLHAKSLNTDVAWEVYDRLVDNYFDNQEKRIDLENLSPELQMVIKMGEAMARQELEQKRQAQEIENVKSAVNIIKAQIATHDEEHFTVAGYASIRGIKVDVNKANVLGRKAAKLSRECGYDISKAHDPRFGSVNMYHVDILKEVFESVS